MRRLPTGGETRSDKRYLAAWEAEYQPLEEALGVQCASFDPTITFRDPGLHESVQLPLWFVRRVNQALEVRHALEAVRMAVRLGRSGHYDIERAMQEIEGIVSRPMIVKAMDAPGPDLKHDV